VLDPGLCTGSFPLRRIVDGLSECVPPAYMPVSISTAGPGVRISARPPHALKGGLHERRDHGGRP
jgi:hypothetical protein